MYRNISRFLRLPYCRNNNTSTLFPRPHFLQNNTNNSNNNNNNKRFHGKYLTRNITKKIKVRNPNFPKFPKKSNSIDKTYNFQ